VLLVQCVGNPGSLINWEEVINSLPEHGDKSYYEPNNWDGKEDYDTMNKLWSDAGISPHVMLVDNFSPEEHYSTDVTKAIEDFLGLTEIESWISKITPGYCVPYHWDFDPKIEPIEGRPLKRYSCRISKHQFGHVFIVADQVLYGGEPGDLYQFPETTSWHAGSNIGLVTKYMYHFIGR
jgi:hypothetical protein